MTLWLRHKGSVASAMLLCGVVVFGPAAMAQEPPAEAPAPQAETPAPETPNDDPAAVRAAHLDELFAELAKPENADWPNVQNQIWAAWSHSGSASMDLLLMRATTAMEEDDYDTAMLHLNDLVRLAPDFAEGWNKRATVLFLRGEYAKSVADIQRVLVLEPRHFGALSGLGIILDRLGDQEGAMLAYRRIIEIHPNMAPAQEAIERLSPDVDGREL
ncbi:tetratricopeptide repeat protein [Rhodobacteraceae bacterium NNCM2]|nr:tetratricopeptide repeat protein [Coraliihabitans acroporae]